MSLDVTADFHKLQDHDWHIVLFLQMTWLMPDTSSYFISCRSLLRAQGVTTSVTAYFRDDEFLKQTHKIFQVCQDLWYTCVCFLFFFFSPLKEQESKSISYIPVISCIPVMSAERIARMLGTYRNDQTPTSYTLYGRSLCTALISFVKMVCPSLLKNCCCDNTPKWQNLLFRLGELI